MPKTAAVVVALDTHGAEAAFVRDHLRRNGLRVLVVDAGTAGEPAFRPDVDRRSLFAAAGLQVDAIRAMGDRAEAAVATTSALGALLPRLLAARKIHGVIALAGDALGDAAEAALRALPLGTPRILVVTRPSDSTPPDAASDTLRLVCPAGLTGLNRLSRPVLANAANAVAGMVRGPAAPRAARERPLVALTAIADTAPCVDAACRRLESDGFDCLVFRADGHGGCAMDQLAVSGHFAGICDVTVSEWADALAGARRPAGGGRPAATAAPGVPRIVSAGGLDRIAFGSPDTVPEAFRDRPLYHRAPDTTLMRTTREECLRLGETLARAASAMPGRTRLILPLRGLSALDREGQPFDGPAARRALFDAIQANLDLGKVELVELDLHLNDPAFGEALAKALLELLGPIAKAARRERATPPARPKARLKRPPIARRRHRARGRA